MPSWEGTGTVKYFRQWTMSRKIADLNRCQQYSNLGSRMTLVKMRWRRTWDRWTRWLATCVTWQLIWAQNWRTRTDRLTESTARYTTASSSCSCHAHVVVADCRQLYCIIYFLVLCSLVNKLWLGFKQIKCIMFPEQSCTYDALNFPL